MAGPIASSQEVAARGGVSSSESPDLPDRQHLEEDHSQARQLTPESDSKLERQIPSPSSSSNTHHEEEKAKQPSTNTNPSITSLSAQADEDPVPATLQNVPSAAPSDPEASRTTLQTSIIMTSLCFSVFLAALDATIITTALPTISAHFHSNAGYTWIGSAYLLANAASVPSWGKFSDIWGRKPILLCAVAVFFIGSALAATSGNIEMLIAARAIQGVGAGGVINLVNICISDLFSMRNRGKYFGMVGMTWAAACSLGPILGGVFSEEVSWRWCFYVNLPITGVVFIALVIFLKLESDTTGVWEGLKAVDWLGTLTIVGGTLMFLLGLEFGGVTFPWSSATVICLIIFGIFTACLFVLNEWRLARYPMMPLRLFKHQNNIAAFGTCFCHAYVFTAGTYYLPLYFQAVLGATPFLSGVYILPFGIALSVVSAITGILIKKTGLYLPWIWSGMLLMTVGFGLYIDLEVTANWPKIIIFQIIAGIGVGPNFQSPLVALQSNVNPGDIATATATFGFTRMLSQAISVVIGGVIFQNQMQKHSSTLTTSLGPTLASQLSGSEAGANIGLIKTLSPSQRTVARQAFFESIRSMYIMYVCFAALGLGVSLCISKQILDTKHKVLRTGLKAEEERYREEKERRRVARESKRLSRESRDGAGTKEMGEEAV